METTNMAAIDDKLDKIMAKVTEIREVQVQTIQRMKHADQERDAMKRSLWGNGKVGLEEAMVRMGDRLDAQLSVCAAARAQHKPVEAWKRIANGVIEKVASVVIIGILFVLFWVLVGHMIPPANIK